MWSTGQKLKVAGVVQGMFPLNDEDKLKALSDAWYSGNQLTQPLGEWTKDVVLCTHTHAYTHTHTYAGCLTQSDTNY